MSHPFRPLFVEVPREAPKSRFGALDMTMLAPMFKAHYSSKPPLVAPPVRADHDG